MNDGSFCTLTSSHYLCLEGKDMYVISVTVCAQSLLRATYEERLRTYVHALTSVYYGYAHCRHTFTYGHL